MGRSDSEAVASRQSVAFFFSKPENGGALPKRRYESPGEAHIGSAAGTCGSKFC